MKEMEEKTAADKAQRLRDQQADLAVEEERRRAAVRAATK